MTGARPADGLARIDGPGLTIIAGGGTAGHVEPALAVADALVSLGHHPDSILFVGSRRGVEARTVPEAGFPIVLLPGRGIVRKVGWPAVEAMLGLSVAAARATRLLRRRRPGIVLSVGGYASAPASSAAIALGVPLVIAEQNAVPGAANRLAARWARAAAVSFAGTPLPHAVVTGNPVRAAVVGVSRAPDARRAARAVLGLPDGRRVVAVSGGSLGARRINDAVIELARLWSDRGDLAIHHAIGRRDWPSFSGRLPTGGRIHYQAVEYEERMPALLAAADVWIGRAGGSTVAELTAVGVPSILVPLPIAPHDHQAVQARQIEAAGGCVVILDADVTTSRIAAELERLFGEPGALERMGAAAGSMGHPDAAARVAELLEQHRRD